MSFGVPFEVVAGTGELAARVPDVLPPDVEFDPTERPRTTFTVHAAFGCACDLPHEGRAWVMGGHGSIAGADDEAVLLALRAAVKLWVAANAPGHVFVHAGVVGWNGRAVLVPGSTHRGKTTLVAALSAAGATYYSDDMAVIDDDGLVHPYLLPLGVRGEGTAQRDVHPASLGVRCGDRPLPLGLVLDTDYRPGAVWSPRPMDRSETLTTLLSNSVGARTSPERTIDVLLRANESCRGWRSPRPDTEAVVAFVADQLGPLGA